MPERLLDDDPAISGAVALLKLLKHRFEHRGRDREVVGRPLRSFELLAERLKSCRIVVVSIHIAQQSGKLLKGRGIDPTMFFEAVMRPRLELPERPASISYADNGHV